MARRIPAGGALIAQDEAMTTATATSTPAQTRRAIWNTIRGSSGNLVEWYDVYIYTVFASYFEGQFFDE